MNIFFVFFPVVVGRRGVRCDCRPASQCHCMTVVTLSAFMTLNGLYNCAEVALGNYSLSHCMIVVDDKPWSQYVVIQPLPCTQTTNL